MKTTVRHSVPLQPVAVHGGADVYLQPIEDPIPEQVDVPEGSCSLWRAHARAGSWQELQPVERNPRWSSLFLKDSSP